MNTVLVHTDIVQLTEQLVDGTLLAENPSSYTDARYQRFLRAALAGPDTADTPVLLRHILRAESERQGVEQHVRIATGIFPGDITSWSRFGLVTTPVGTDYRLRAEPWRPDWLDDVSAHGVDGAACALLDRRSQLSCPGDPFLESFNFETYSCDGQREAIRAVLEAPPGSTLIVNLPTGSGKSLCAYVAGKIPFTVDSGKGLTLVIVPTTALALDQERATQAFFPEPTAYSSADTDERRDRNREIRLRIRSGQQRILFTSPESVLGSLRPALYEAARQGYLRTLIVDEAHIIDQWGDHFRPAFQGLAGLRQALLAECPYPAFRTLLLTATLTSASFEAIYQLFSQPGPVRIVSAPLVRPEPSYWFGYCQDESERQQRLREAVDHLPRPLIVYTTLVRDAQQYYRMLRNSGYRRIDLMTGDSASGDREQIIRRWSEGDTDVVVATAAFGLGIDKRDVRCVIHACLPETFDRFYQEVGRGGRDGKASISLMLYTEEDKRLARRMGQKKVITIPLGFPRWQEMFRNAEYLDETASRYRVQVDIPPGTDPRHVSMDSTENMQWHLRTLNLMARAQLLTMSDELHDQGNESDDVDMTRVVLVADPHHLDQAHWQTVLEPVRRQIIDATRRQFQLLTEALRGKQCIAELLTKAYTLPRHQLPGVNHELRPARACGGCPHCRRTGRTPYNELPSTEPVRWDTPMSLGSTLTAYLAGQSSLAIFYVPGLPQHELQRDITAVVQWLQSQGVFRLYGPEVFRAAIRNDYREKPLFFLDTLQVRWRPVTDPTIVLIQHSDPPQLLAHCLARLERLPLILILPKDICHPERPDRHCWDYLTCPRMLLATILTTEGAV